MATITLPPPEKDIVEAYLQLVKKVEQEKKRVENLLDIAQKNCKPGCSQCCIQFSVLPVEAALLSHRGEGKEISTSPEHCVFLNQKRCTVYPWRPLLCRTQGLPLGYVDFATRSIDVSACTLNFPEKYQFTQEAILIMEEINEQLVELNTRYCLRHNVDPHRRIELADIPHL